MRWDRLLNNEDGSAPIESIFSMVLLLLLMLGVIQVGLALYARNVLIASAHEGARAAVERGASGSDAETIATAAVRRSAGGLVRDLQVDVEASRSIDATIVTVHVAGTVGSFGPVPIPVPVSVDATATRPEPPR